MDVTLILILNLKTYLKSLIYTDCMFHYFCMIISIPHYQKKKEKHLNPPL